jgi:hypothetical protein
MTYTRYLELISTCKQFKTILDSSLDELEPETRVEFPISKLEPLKGLKRLADTYLLVPKDDDELKALARHPSLLEANIKLDLPGIILFLEIYLGSRVVPTAFKFSFRLPSEEGTLIEITPSSLNISSSLRSLNLEDFYRRIGALLPISKYSGDMNSSLIGLQHLARLNSILLNCDFGFIMNMQEGSAEPIYVNYDLFEWLLRTARLDRLEDFSLRYEKHSYGNSRETIYEIMVRDFLHYCEKKDLVFPKMKSTFPVPYKELWTDTIVKIFPNAEEVRILISSIYSSLIGNLSSLRESQKHSQAHLDHFKRITLIKDISNPIPEEKIYLYFPHDKTSIV